MKLQITGMGWHFQVPIRKENGEIIIPEKDFWEMMKAIAYTHDVVSGGFWWKEVDDEYSSCIDCPESYETGDLPTREECEACRRCEW